MVSGVLVKEGYTVQARVVFYNAVVQAFLLYRIYIWVFAYSVMKVLEGLHHRIACSTEGDMAWSVGVERLEWPPVEETLEVSVLCPMQENFTHRQVTVEEYISIRLIY